MSNSSTGYLGVFKHNKGFKDQIATNKVQKYLGTFSTPQLASEAYLKAKRDLHSTCTI